MFNSVRSRLILSFALIVAVTLLAAGVALIARLTGYRDDLSAGTLRQVAAPIYYNLTLFTPRPQNPSQSGAALRAELGAYIDAQERAGVTVLFLDASGRPLAGTADEALLDEQFRVPPPPDRDIDFAGLPEGTYTTSEGDELLYVTVPTPRYIRAQDTSIHAIVVALPKTERSAIWGELAPRLFFAGMIGAVAAIVAAVLLWGSMFRGLRKVAGAIQAVAAGDYGQRVPESGPSELRALARDVNKMADAVEASHSTLREFLANVSHELKTPLTSIRGFSQALVDGTMESPEERARAARVIDAESRRVLQLVGELLDLARIESGQQRMQLAPVPVDELLAHVRDVFSLRASETGVALRVDTTLATSALADFDRIEQVLGNLLDNAFRHTPRGGSIIVAARDRGDGFVEISVADNGEGIPPDELPQVFDRFYRNALGEPEMPGAGLGLAIARQIVLAHGGEIAASAVDGGGTRFTFTLPVAPAAAPSSAPEPAPRPEGLQPG